jgi:hypothetical protein
VYILSARSGMNFGRENAGAPNSSKDPSTSVGEGGLEADSGF